MKFSVLMSVYDKEIPEYLTDALLSLQNQTVQPDEIVIVKDGRLSQELDAVIMNFSKEMPIKCIELENNVGLGKALQIGVLACSNAYIARMDSDDISTNDRFEKQINFFKMHPDVDVLGGWISEFDGERDNIYAVRGVPTAHNDIVKYAKKRNPFNHMTVMFRKESVVKVGSYLNYRFAQDYNLWARMVVAGCRFANVADILVNVRAGMDMVIRRSGMKYAKTEYNLQKEFLNIGFLSYTEYITNLMLRIPVRFLPASLIKMVYKKLRK